MSNITGAEGLFFTDDDLQSYSKPSDVRKAPGPEPARNSPASPSPGAKETGPPGKPNQIEVPYKPFEGGARRVIIQVKFNDSVTAPMVLDTGSPGMLMSYSLAEKLRLFDKDNGLLLRSAAGIGGSVPAILTVVDSVQVGEARDHFIPTTITSELSDSFEGLIGMDFLSNYAIKVDSRKRVVVFEELSPKGNMPAGHDEIWWRLNFHDFASARQGWKDFRQMLDRKSRELQSRAITTGDIENLKLLKEFAERQYEESDKLFYKLHKYAAEHSVPMEWREY